MNIEFEAKLFVDIIGGVNSGCCIAFRDPNIPEKVSNDYMFDIIVPVRQNPKNIINIFGGSYLQWMQLYDQYHPEYSSPIDSSLNSPSAISSIISSSNC